MALVYKKLNKYDEALKYLKILTDKFEIIDNRKILDVKMLHANCLRDLREFEEADNEYIEILHSAMKFNDKNNISLAYGNLAELHFNKTNYKEAAKLIKESLKHNPGNFYLNRNLYFAAKVFENINEDGEMYLLRALDVCEKNDMENLILIEKIIYELVLIYINREDETNIMLMVEKT